MELEHIRAIARSHQISPGKCSKTELIKAIQSEEGNFDCFSTAYGGECDQVGCCWRQDCFASSALAKGE